MSAKSIILEFLEYKKCSEEILLFLHNNKNKDLFVLKIKDIYLNQCGIFKNQENRYIHFFSVYGSSWCQNIDVSYKNRAFALSKKDIEDILLLHVFL